MLGFSLHNMRHSYSVLCCCCCCCCYCCLVLLSLSLLFSFALSLSRCFLSHIHVQILSPRWSKFKLQSSSTWKLSPYSGTQFCLFPFRFRFRCGAIYISPHTWRVEFSSTITQQKIDSPPYLGCWSRCYYHWFQQRLLEWRCCCSLNGSCFAWG